VDLISSTLTVDGAVQLGHSIKSLTFLQSLDLMGTVLSNGCLLAILNGLQNRALNLKFLGLEATGIGSPSSLSVICDSIQQGLIVQQLTLKANYIGDIGAEFVGQLVGTLMHLTHLNISGCNIGDTGLMFIIEGAIARNNLQIKLSACRRSKETLFINLMENPVTVSGFLGAKQKMPTREEGMNITNIVTSRGNIPEDRDCMYTIDEHDFLDSFTGICFENMK